MGTDCRTPSVWTQRQPATRRREEAGLLRLTGLAGWQLAQVLPSLTAPAGEQPASGPATGRCWSRNLGFLPRWQTCLTLRGSRHNYTNTSILWRATKGRLAAHTDSYGKRRVPKARSKVTSVSPCGRLYGAPKLTIFFLFNSIVFCSFYFIVFYHETHVTHQNKYTFFNHKITNNFK